MNLLPEGKTLKKANRPVSEPKHDDSFKVVDRRLFTETGELRQDMLEEERRREEAQKKAQDSAKNAANPAGSPAPAASAPPSPPREAPKESLAFKQLVGFLAQNAEMVLRGFPDPRTGRAVLDIESLRQIIDMIEALKEKSEGNRSPEESEILTQLLGDLKYTFVQVQAQAAAPAMKNPTSRKP